MAQKRKSKRKVRGGKWLVRGPEGELYVITKTKVVQLQPKKVKKLQGIIKKAERELDEAIAVDIPSLASGVSLAITEAFGHD
jgi:hypothetical protein